MAFGDCYSVLPFLVIPGIGPVLVAGPLVAWMVAALEGPAVVRGLSAIGVGLYSVGVPKDSIPQYELAVRAGKFLLIVDGKSDEIATARDAIKTGASGLDTHETQPVKA